MSMVLLIAKETVLVQGVLPKLSAPLLPGQYVLISKLVSLCLQTGLFQTHFPTFYLEQFYQQNHVYISCFKNIIQAAICVTVLAYGKVAIRN